MNRVTLGVFGEECTSTEKELVRVRENERVRKAVKTKGGLSGREWRNSHERWSKYGNGGLGGKSSNANRAYIRKYLNGQVV